MKIKKTFYVYLIILIKHIRNLHDQLATSCQKVETKYKNKIKETHAQGIASSPKCKNVIPSTSRFKKKTSAQSSVTSSNLTEIDDKIDTQLITSNKTNFPLSYDSITFTNIDTSELSTITSYTIRSSRSLEVLTKLSTRSSNAIEINSTEVNNNNDVSELSVISSYIMQSSRSSRIPVRVLVTSSNKIEVDTTSSSTIKVNDNEVSNYNNASELSIITSYTIKSSKFST
ncbi:22004_t:CDS:2 [Cetraspora pellucida]|uniref:22004_t:CDS:1 n=1 Tax=Cetraspora pellucida TaxID=1433469 RepID=A0A9N9P4A6_9GLOM|nr:22004_t:CDS:2 [Cetraspora pellucida]